MWRHKEEKVVVVRLQHLLSPPQKIASAEPKMKEQMKDAETSSQRQHRDQHHQALCQLLPRQEWRWINQRPSNKDWTEARGTSSD